MNTLKPMAWRAIPIIVSIHALVMAASLTGCGRDQTKNIKNTAPIADENTLPPVNPNQYDVGPPAGLEASKTGLHDPIPQTDTTTPVPLTPHANPVQGGSKEYVVIRGDTLFKIARANGVKFSALTNANPNLNLSKLKAGQKIQIPASESSASTGIGFREPSHRGKGALPSPGNIHVVKAGETLTQIAKQSHTTVKAIQAVNGLKTTRVLVGQKLRLPAQSAA
jgi:LysM repeat protein